MCSTLAKLHYSVLLIFRLSSPVLHVYPGCRIRIFPSRIPGQKDSRIPDPHPHQRFKYFDQSCSSRVRIPDFDFLPIPDTGSRGLKGTGSRIRNNVLAQTGLEGEKTWPHILCRCTFQQTGNCLTRTPYLPVHRRKPQQWPGHPFLPPPYWS